MNIEEITIGEARQIAALVQGLANPAGEPPDVFDGLIGKLVIVRTRSAGVHCGVLAKKAGTEVILSGSRRLWRWQAVKSISLSAVAVHGIDRSRSLVSPTVEEQWLNAIEIIPVAKTAADSIMGADDAQVS